jgi:type IV pilus biogenesis protein CpaD/CtpE
MKFPAVILALALSALSSAGCFGAYRASRLDANWGSAQRANLRAMIADPIGTPFRARPDEPADGASAQAAVRKYRIVEARPPRVARQGGTIINVSGR